MRNIPELMIGCSESKGKIIQENAVINKGEKTESGLTLIGQTTGNWVKIYPWVSANRLFQQLGLVIYFCLGFSCCPHYRNVHEARVGVATVFQNL